MPSPVLIVDYDPRWQAVFLQERARIASILGDRTVQIEHAGSTSVPGMAAKPVIDETAYAPSLKATRYSLSIREPEWYELRMFKGPGADIHLHVFSRGCPEIGRMIAFWNWLRGNESDRELYMRTKLTLAAREWGEVQDYADARTAIVAEILSRALASG